MENLTVSKVEREKEAEREKIARDKQVRARVYRGKGNTAEKSYHDSVGGAAFPHKIPVLHVSWAWFQ